MFNDTIPLRSFSTICRTHCSDGKIGFLQMYMDKRTRQSLMQVLIFANGEAKRGSMVDQAIQRLQSAHVLCADGGALRARKFGLKPHTIIGDLDSLTAPQVEQFAADGTEILRFPTQKDETDLELALSWCLDNQASEIVIIGALGGRIDQTLANIILHWPCRNCVVFLSRSSMAIRPCDSCGPVRTTFAGGQGIQFR